MKKPYLKTLALFLGLTGLASPVLSQECGTLSYEEEIRLDESLSPQQKEQLIQQYYDTHVSKWEQWSESSRSGQKADIMVIPLVFHVFHRYGPENISMAQVKDQVRILNEDFNGQNASISQLVNEFKSIAGNTEIEFRLATLDPDGNCTDGVIRHYDPKTYYDGRGPIQQHKRDYGWPSDKYMNIYVVGSIETSGNGGTILGYAQFPGGNPATDGFVVRHDNVGSIGTSNPGRATTSTHEIGHMLGLFHTWGNCAAAGSPNACNCDDGVADTPNTQGHPSTCNLGAETCGSLDNVQNFMDYATCAVNFTQGQSDRMRGVMENDAARRNLFQPANLVATGADYAKNDPPTTLCDAAFDFNDKVNYCPGEDISFTDRSFHKVTSRTWTFEDGEPATSGDANPTVNFTTSGLKTVKLVVTNGVETDSITRTVYISSGDELGGYPFADDIENVDLSNLDQYEIFDKGGNISWRLSSTISHNGGSKCFYLPNISADDEEENDDIISNTIDLSSASSGAKLSFDVAHARTALTNGDQLRVAFSNDCGQTWFNVASLTRNSLATAPNHTNAFFPEESEWARKSFDIPAEYLVSSFMFKFSWVGGGGNNAFIDNININETGTGIDENFLESSMTLFPNPATSTTTLSFTLLSNEQVDIRIIDVAGKEVSNLGSKNFNKGENQIMLNTDALVPGLYMVKVSSTGATASKRLIVQP